MHALSLDSLQSTALANLAIMRAFKYRDFAAGAALIKKAEIVDPSNPEIFMIEANMFRAAHAYDRARDAIRFARQLDPMTPFYRQWEANLELCADRPEIALKLNESDLRMNPSDRVARLGLTRSLAMLYRYDEAIASWRTEARQSGDTTMVRALKSAHGASDYWKLVHAEGRSRLAAIRRGTIHVLPAALIQAEFAAGDADAAFKDLDKIAESENRPFYRLACMRDVDEFRHTARFAAAAAKIGALRIH
jgi:tetratricopeptide (TPR) repeat protein